MRLPSSRSLSLAPPGKWSIRIEDVIVCAEGSATTLNDYSTDLVTTSAAGMPA